MAQLGDFSAARGVDEMGLVTISIAHEDGPNTNTKYKQNSSSKIEVVFNVNGSDSATVICDN